MLSLRSRPVTAVTAVLLLGSLAACGGDEADGTGGSGEDSDVVALTVSETAGIPSLFLSYGVQEGYFTDEGLDVEVTASAGGASVIPALVSGDIDVAGSNLVSVLLAASQGLPLQVVAAGTSASDDPAEDFSGLVVPAASTVQDPSGLAGQRIAVNTLQNINDVVIAGVLEQNDLSIDDVELVEIPFPEMLPSLERGDVDAALLIEPFLTDAVDSGVRVVEAPYSAVQAGLQIGCYVMTSQLAQEDPELADRFATGVQATADAIAADPDAFRAAIPELGEFDPDAATRIRLPMWRGATDLASVEVIQDLMVDGGLIGEPNDLDALIRG